MSLSLHRMQLRPNFICVCSVENPLTAFWPSTQKLPCLRSITTSILSSSSSHVLILILSSRPPSVDARVVSAMPSASVSPSKAIEDLPNDCLELIIDAARLNHWNKSLVDVKNLSLVNRRFRRLCFRLLFV